MWNIQYFMEQATILSGNDIHIRLNLLVSLWTQRKMQFWWFFAKKNWLAV